MKVKSSVKPICAKCKVVRRRGVVRMLCENPTAQATPRVTDVEDDPQLLLAQRAANGKKRRLGAAGRAVQKAALVGLRAFESDESSFRM